jgi:hypothetical protein
MAVRFTGPPHTSRQKNAALRACLGVCPPRKNRYRASGLGSLLQTLPPAITQRLAVWFFGGAVASGTAWCCGEWNIVVASAVQPANCRMAAGSWAVP